MKEFEKQLDSLEQKIKDLLKQTLELMEQVFNDLEQEKKGNE